VGAVCASCVGGGGGGGGGRLRVNAAAGGGGPASGKAGGAHQLGHGLDGWRIGARETAGVALGEEERCAAKFVRLTPDLRIGSTFGEQFHHAWVDVICGSMHGRITLVVHAVDVGSEI